MNSDKCITLSLKNQRSYFISIVMNFSNTCDVHSIFWFACVFLGNNWIDFFWSFNLLNKVLALAGTVSPVLELWVHELICLPLSLCLAVSVLLPAALSSPSDCTSQILPQTLQVTLDPLTSGPWPFRAPRGSSVSVTPRSPRLLQLFSSPSLPQVSWPSPASISPCDSPRLLLTFDSPRLSGSFYLQYHRLPRSPNPLVPLGSFSSHIPQAWVFLCFINRTHTSPGPPTSGLRLVRITCDSSLGAFAPGLPLAPSSAASRPGTCGFRHPSLVHGVPTCRSTGVRTPSSADPWTSSEGWTLRSTHLDSRRQKVCRSSTGHFYLESSS